MARSSEVKPLIQDGSVTVADINSAERAVERDMLMTITDLKRGLGVLATVGATAPFVGLLGTTMGIVNAFTGMAASGSGGLAAISAGIAEALITTAFGLLVAIPAVWAYNYFQTKIDNLTAEMTYISKEMIDYLIKGVSRRVRPVALHPRVQHAPAARRTPDLAADRSQPTRRHRDGNVNRWRRSGVKAEPNVTPMIDVMLVLLIIFMVVIPALIAGFNADAAAGQST